ncbi:MAG: cyclodeaminase/cyclohydrolase family protein [Solirubrobacterales bacterium]|nr:cyclodeaminase/cyclohydrolase family protein [Solirubrobacterales bacterium]
MASADRSLADLLESVAERTPAPGGGTSAAWACALAASLVEMAAAFASPPRPEVCERAATLRARALELAEEDLGAYAGVLEALKLPRTDPERAGRRDAALSAAADSPLAIAGAATEVAVIAAQLAETGNPHLNGDAVVGALLAESAALAAVRLLELNLADQAQDDPRREAAGDLAGRAAVARARVLGEPPR